jgi:DUF1680 family protein
LPNDLEEVHHGEFEVKCALNKIDLKVKSRIVITFLCVTLNVLPASAAKVNSPLKAVPVAAVQVKDRFWSPKLTVYRENTIPHSWGYIEDNIKAMKKIAGLADEPFKTGLWTEANLYKFMETAAYSLAVHPDPKLEKQLDEVIHVIAAARS